MECRLQRGSLTALSRDGHASSKRNLAYWKSRPAAERIAAVSYSGLSTLDLAPDFDEFCALLIAERVEFVVIGADALAFHGRRGLPVISIFCSTLRSSMDDAS